MIPKNRQPTHPGVILGEALKGLGITQDALAQKLGVSKEKVCMLIDGRSSMTRSVAEGLAKVIDTSPEMWMNLQRARDLWVAQPRRHSDGG